MKNSRKLLTKQGSFEKSWPQAQCLYQMLEIQAKSRPHNIAITAPGYLDLTYYDLFIQAQNITDILNTIGIGRNDRVAIVLPNGPEMAVTFIGVATCATSAPLNPSFTAEEFDFYLSDMNAKALIVSADDRTDARNIARKHGITIIELIQKTEEKASVLTLSSDVRSHATNPGFARPDDVALILYTSGTTSRPKLVPLTQTNFCTSAHNMSMSCALVETDRCLNVMPLFHAHAIMTSLAASLVAGASVVCTHRFNDSEFFVWMKEFRPTWYTAVPTIHQAILNIADQHQAVITNTPLRFIRSASSSLSAQVMANLESTFQAPVIEAYGMTEACSQITSNPLPPRDRRINSVGIPTGCEVTIINEEGTRLSSEEEGEIIIRGENVMRAYERNPEANAAAFINGWFKTGDLGYLDEDGYLFITGRVKEVINRGGRKISPSEVDKLLQEHPSVKQVVTFARPHATLGEDVIAAVVLEETAAETEWEIRRFALQRLADFKVPSQIIIVNEIPKGPTGKIQRLNLYEKLASKLKVEFMPPTNHAEHVLVKIWREVLDVDQVGIHDNFFDLGGNSLLIAKVKTKIQEELDQDIPVIELFAYSTISTLAHYLFPSKGALPRPQQQEENIKAKLHKGKSKLLQQLERNQRAVKD